MKTVLLSPESAKQMKPISPLQDNYKSNNREDDKEKEDSYFNGCRKDANCECNMCLESITATLDLMSISVQKSSLTKLSASKPAFNKTPVSLSIQPTTLLSTPKTKTSPLVDSKQTVIQKKLGSKFKSLRCWVLLLGLILGFEFGFSWGVIRILRPTLSEHILNGVTEEFSNVHNLSEKLNLIEKSLNDSVHGRLSSCILGDSSWRINQDDGLILMSYCNMYKSAAEEVLIWGWPLQTGGLLAAGFSPRSFKVLSGRITEWPEGRIMYVVREANTAWTLRKWNASVVQFEPNTWVIEYRRNPLLENPSIWLLLVEYIKLRILKFSDRMRQHIWLLPDFRYHSSSASQVVNLDIPT